MSEPRSALEEKVVKAALGARDEVVGLVIELVACDTTARLPGQPAHAVRCRYAPQGLTRCARRRGTA